MTMVEEDTSSDGSSHRRKNNQNTFSWSSVSSTFSNATLFTNEEEIIAVEEEETTYSYFLLLNEFHQLESADIKTKRLTEILCRAASHGDVHTIQHMMMNERLRPFINIDATDDEENEGSTPLIYASCFGKLQVVTYLLQIAKNLEIVGWTALMWAATNNHHQIVQVLLEYSASFDTTSSSGKSIYDLVDVENEQLVSILNNPLWQNKRKPSTWSKRTLKKQKKAVAAVAEEDDLLDYEASFKSVDTFLWDQCLLDQMFVFAEDGLEYILDIAIAHLKLPMKSRSEIYVPVNIVFLCARFAHYFSSRELLNQLLSKSIYKINQVVKSNKNDIHILAFWIANLSQLLYYLKKDVGLVVVTAEYQLEIAELISETYTFLVHDSERRLGRILEPAMIEHENIDGLETVHFADDWHRFFRRNRISTSSMSSSSTSSGSPNRRSFGNTTTFESSSSSSLSQQQQQLQQQQQQQPIRNALSPQSIMSLLTSTLYVMQSYDVHPVIVIQAVAQLFHYVSCELFNCILLNKKYLCRSRALQIRMNMTLVEEWIREHHLPSTLSAYFNPVIQLVQLLQCVSQLTDLMDFITTTKSFDLLNPTQIRRVVLNYRYEVNEPKLPEEIEKYTMQLAEDTMKIHHHTENSTSTTTSRISTESHSSSHSSNSSRPSSISSLGNLLLYNMKKKQQQLQTTDEDVIQEQSNNNNHRDWVIEKKDSQYMLPFSLPTTANMVSSGWTTQQQQQQRQHYDFEKMSLSDKIYYELKQKLLTEREKHIREKSIIPTIPEEWLEKLDLLPV